VPIATDDVLARCVAFVDERRVVAGGRETLIQSARTEPRRRLSMLEDVER
jgi:hypothetical protein